MKARRKKLTAATLSAFLALAGAIQAHDTGGDKVKTTGKKSTKVRSHKGGHHRRHRRSGKKGSTTSTSPAPK